MYGREQKKNRLEAVTQRCCLKNVFLEISQNSQENTCVRVSFEKLCESSNNTFLSRAPPVAASDCHKIENFIVAVSNDIENITFN